MTTATLEVVRPKQKEPAQQKIRVPGIEEDGFVRGVAENVSQLEPSFPPQQVRPVTAATPVPPSPDLAAVQAERVGSQEPSINLADVAHNVKIARSVFTGESIWARIGRAFGWVNLIKRRAAQKMAAKKEYKPIDI